MLWDWRAYRVVGDPARVAHRRRVTVAVAKTNRGDRTPEAPEILGFEAGCEAVRLPHLKQSQGSRQRPTVHLPNCGELHGDLHPRVENRLAPEEGEFRLVGGAGRADCRAERLDLVVVLCVGVA